MWKFASGVLAALLTLWVVPQLTRQAQDRTAERKLKASIVQDVIATQTELSSVAVFRAFKLVQRMDNGTIAFKPDGSFRKPPPSRVLPPKSYSDAFVQWRKKARQIETRIRVEFPHNRDISDVYERVMNVTNVWYFVGQNPRAPTHIRALQHQINRLDERIERHGWESGKILLPERDLAILSNGQADKRSISAFYNAYLGVEQKIFASQDAVLKRIDEAQAEGLSTTSCDLGRTVITMPPGGCSPF